MTRAETSVAGGWTVETSHAYFQSVLKEMNLRIEQRFDGQEKAVLTALASAKEAVSKAEIAAEKRFEGLNELREVVTKMLSQAMPRAEAESGLALIREKLSDAMASERRALEELSSRLVALDKKIESFTSERVGSRDTVGNFRANVATLIAIISLVMAISMALYSANRPAVANVVAPVSTAPR